MHLNQVSKPPKLALFHTKKQRLDSKLSPHIPKAKPSHLLEE